MKITNIAGLPEPIVEAIRNDPYTKGDAHYSATQLINPPRIVHLTNRHWHELEEDAMDRIWTLFGKAIHQILDAAQAQDAIQEERIFIEILGRKISGAADLYENGGLISDYKVTSAWTLVFDSRADEWAQQLNTYAYMFRQLDFPVEKLQVVAILRDWSKRDALRSVNYPQQKVQVIDVPLWDEAKQLAYLDSRVALMIETEETPDEDLPPCTTHEMWEQPTKFAVMKEGRKTAVRVFDDADEAQAFITTDKDRDKLFVDVRYGKRTRCEEYCSVNRFCNIYAEYALARAAKFDDES